MTQARYGDDGAVERRDEARRRLWPITSAVLAGGAVLTAGIAGIAWVNAPGRGASSPLVSPSSDDASPYVDQGLQAPNQAPGYGGFGHRSHTVSGGS
jgi:hypothetical protein